MDACILLFLFLFFCFLLDQLGTQLWYIAKALVVPPSIQPSHREGNKGVVWFVSVVLCCKSVCWLVVFFLKVCAFGSVFVSVDVVCIFVSCPFLHVGWLLFNEY